MVPVAGVDGCKAGWVVVSDGRSFVCRDFAGVMAALPENTVVGIDIPVGLLEFWLPGGRACDRAARASLGSKHSSVFSAPPRAAFGAATLVEARARGCRMNLQTVKIMPKVEDVDRIMTPALQSRVFEVHPELSFVALNGRRPLGAVKRHRAGRAERRRLLQRAGLAIPDPPRAGVHEDDLLDACAVAWSASRLACGEGERLPDPPPRDLRGLRMEICW
jgi:predicted RNase H-like nuclease